MANQIFSRVLPKTITLTTFLSRSISTTTTTPFSSALSFLRRLRPLSAAAITSRHIPLPFRAFSTRPTPFSLNDPNPNLSNHQLKEMNLYDGCDFEHWLVVMEKPEGDPTRDEIIDSYVKTLAEVLGSEEVARKSIYSVSTRHYFAFGALCPLDLSHKLKELPKVQWVIPDSYVNVKEKDYGGEPFINGQAVPYDPKYHEEWDRDMQSRPPVQNSGPPANNAAGYPPKLDMPLQIKLDMDLQIKLDVHLQIKLDMPLQMQVVDTRPPNMSGPPPNMSRPPPPNSGYGAPQNNYPAQENQNMAGMPPNAGRSNNQ